MERLVGTPGHDCWTRCHKKAKVCKWRDTFPHFTYLAQGKIWNYLMAYYKISLFLWCAAKLILWIFNPPSSTDESLVFLFMRLTWIAKIHIPDKQNHIILILYWLLFVELAKLLKCQQSCNMLYMLKINFLEMNKNIFCDKR